jgi:hypothetical protein
MRDWKWDMSGRGDGCWLIVDLVPAKPLADCRLLISEATLPGFVLATPEYVATLSHLKGEETDCYFGEAAYWQLPFYTGRNYYGPCESVEVSVTTLRTYYIHSYVTLEFNRQSLPTGAVTRALADIVRSRQLTVRHWRVAAGWDGSTAFSVEGDDEALIKYLEMDEPQ